MRHSEDHSALNVVIASFFSVASLGLPLVARAQSDAAREGRALLFAPADNGISLAHPQVKWLLEDGSRIDLGGLRIDSQSIGFQLDQAPRSAMAKKLIHPDRTSALVTNLSFSWPMVLSKSGTVSIETLAGDVKWSTVVSEDNVEAWSQQEDRISSAAHARHRTSQWGLLDAPKEAFEFLWAGGEFRTCLTHVSSSAPATSPAQETPKSESLKVCSSPFRSEGSQDKLVIGPLPGALPRKGENKANVYLGNKAIGPSGVVNFNPEKLLQLKIAFNDQSFFEITSKPRTLEVLDIIESTDGRSVVITGTGAQPLGDVKIIKRPETHFWSRTGVDQPTIWQTVVPRESPVLRVTGSYCLPFTLLLKFQRLPRESDRVLIHPMPTDGTYSSQPVLTLAAPEGRTLESQESKVDSLPENRFAWTFNAPQLGQTNSARVTIQDGSTPDQKWVAHHELFRSQPYEASARLTGITTLDGQLTFLGEVAGGGWFDRIGSSQSDLFSTQRWGVTARYLEALSSIKVPDGQSIQTLRVLNTDVKYNLLRGLWNRDELFGLMLSLQRAQVDSSTALVVGGGAYWARTMPKIFNDLFELLPIFRYRKYVDVEFAYYPLSFDSNVTAKASYNLNFHGKVFWTESFYGEAGFGLKNYQFLDKARDFEIELGMAYGTFGVGVVF